MPSVSRGGSDFFLSWGLTTVSHSSWERSIYFLSLLNLWKKRESLLSWLPMTATYHALWRRLSIRRKLIKQNHLGKDTFRFIMLRQIPLSRVDLFYLQFPRPVSEEEDYIWTLRWLSQVGLQDKAVFSHTHFLPVLVSRINTEKSQSHIHVTTHR